MRLEGSLFACEIRPGPESRSKRSLAKERTVEVLGDRHFDAGKIAALDALLHARFFSNSAAENFRAAFTVAPNNLRESCP